MGSENDENRPICFYCEDLLPQGHEERNREDGMCMKHKKMWEDRALPFLKFWDEVESGVFNITSVWQKPFLEWKLIPTHVVRVIEDTDFDDQYSTDVHFPVISSNTVEALILFRNCEDRPNSCSIRRTLPNSFFREAKKGNGYVYCKGERASLIKDHEVKRAGGVLKYAKANFCYIEEAICVVGDMTGIEDELLIDILLVCKHFDLDGAQILQEVYDRQKDDKDTLTVIDCVFTSKQGWTYSPSPTKGRLRIVVTPTIQEFENIVKNTVAGLWGRTVSIFYCGHCSPYGHWSLAYDNYHASALSQLLNSIGVDYSPEVVLVLNCCYAIQFCHHLTDRKVDDLLHLWNVNFKEKINTVLKAKEPLSKEIQATSDEVVESILECFGPNMSGIELKWGKTKLQLFPLSFGPLAAEGAIQTYFKLGIEQITRFNFPKRESRDSYENYEKLRNYVSSKPIQSMDTPEEPEICAFRAGKGDSSLLRFHKWNILIDGGNFCDLKKVPRFWDYIGENQAINLAILTHGDNDHLNGLKVLMGRKYYELTHSQLTRTPEIQNILTIAVKPNLIRRDRQNWSGQNKLRYLAEKANIYHPQRFNDPREIVQNKILFEQVNNDCSMKIKCVLPTADYNTKALKYLEGCLPSRDLTEINRYGLVFVVTCQKGDIKWNMLFTGDADGSDIVDALNKTGFSQTEFDYVDVPHHGSKENNQSHFLSKVNTLRLLVSTNGTHEHPSDECVTELVKKLKGNADLHVYTTYHTPCEKVLGGLGDDERDLSVDEGGLSNNDVKTRVHAPHKEDIETNEENHLAQKIILQKIG